MAKKNQKAAKAKANGAPEMDIETLNAEMEAVKAKLKALREAKRALKGPRWSPPKGANTPASQVLKVAPELSDLMSKLADVCGHNGWDFPSVEILIAAGASRYVAQCKHADKRRAAADSK